MKVKKRKKVKRMRGTRHHGWAAKKHKGKGSHGGKGMAGTGKRADHKKTLILTWKEKYFGKQGITSKGTKRDKSDVINLEEIMKNISSFVKQGKAKKIDKGYEIDLKGYKILGEGELDVKLIIKAKSASKSALEKIKAAGGELVK